MTDIPDARVAAWTCAWNSLIAAGKLRQPPKDAQRLRVAPEPLPEMYWAAVAEAAIFADLARADLDVGQTAFQMINAVETAKNVALRKISEPFDVNLDTDTVGS